MRNYYLTGVWFGVLRDDFQYQSRSGARLIRENSGMDLAEEFQLIYESEINLAITWLWDGGIDIRLGDAVNGFLAEENVRTMAEILPWIQEAIAHFYPSSDYAQSLDPELRERAAKRLFWPPAARARVICPRCGAPNAGPDMDQIFIYVCRRCGESVELPRPKLQ